CFFFFSSRRRHTRWPRDWSSDVCSSDLVNTANTVTAKSHSAAVDIKILPTPTLGGVLQSTPLVEIIVGEANAKATYDRLTGKPRSEERRVGKECRARETTST